MYSICDGLASLCYTEFYETKYMKKRIKCRSHVQKCIHFGVGSGIPGVISSAPTEITLSAVRLRRRGRLQEKLPHFDLDFSPHHSFYYHWNTLSVMFIYDQICLLLHLLTTVHRHSPHPCPSPYLKLNHHVFFFNQTTHFKLRLGNWINLVWSKT